MLPRSNAFLLVSFHDENHFSSGHVILSKGSSVNATDLPLNVDVAVRHGDKDNLQLIGFSRKGQQQRENVVDALYVVSIRPQCAGSCLPRRVFTGSVSTMMRRRAMLCIVEATDLELNEDTEFTKWINIVHGVLHRLRTSHVTITE